MFDVFKISFGEYKKIFSKKSVYITLGVLFLFFLMAVDQMVKTNNAISPQKIISGINIMFFGIMQFLIMFRGASLLPEEFKCGTTAFVFTSNKSRSQILLSKILAFVLFGISIGAMSFVLIMYYMVSKNLPVYYSVFCINIVLCVIYSWFIGNYFLFCTVVLKSTVVSFVTGIFFLYLLEDIILQLGNKLSISSKLLDFIPFCDVFKFIAFGDFNANKIIGFLIGGVIFFVLSAFIFEKQDLA